MFSCLSCSITRSCLPSNHYATTMYVHPRSIESSNTLTNYTNFLSIFRPDLVDFGKVRRQTARQNLNMAFHLAERELGVTRLLDAEGKAL